MSSETWHPQPQEHDLANNAPSHQQNHPPKGLLKRLFESLEGRPHDVTELGRLVKIKYPHYRSMSDIEAGREVRRKFAPAYDDFEDTEELEKPGTIYEN